MKSITTNVRDIGAGARSCLESLIGQPLEEHQQLVIQVITPTRSEPEQLQDHSSGAGVASDLPDWCHVFTGLTEEQIAELEETILSRSNWSRL